jgi:hypothetical protein
VPQAWPLDHLTAGSEFPLIAADLGPSATVEITVTAGGQVVDLATVVAGPDGHFQTNLRLPQNIPDGYVRLRATRADESSAEAWVRVGEGPDLSIPTEAGGLDLMPFVSVGLALLALVLPVLQTRRRPTR